LIAEERLGDIAAEVETAVDDLAARKAPARMWAGDHTLWADDPTEIADRLGWLHVVEEMEQALADIDGVALAAVADGLTDAVLCGMGGSSLFPEVLRRSFPKARLDLTVLDTTDPAAIARAPLDRSLFVAASKSGSTIETTSQLAHFWAATGGASDRFLAITDPGTSLAQLGQERGFRRVFENRPDIGGRYSALSYFGLVPGALYGADVAGLLQRALQAVDGLGAGVPAKEHAGVRLGAILGAAAMAGRDKLTLVLPDRIASFGLWLEQLVAESTGKEGTGIVPVTGEPLGPPAVYGDDRLFVAVGDHDGLDALAAAGHPVVRLDYTDERDLGALVLLWEQAVALAGAVLGINPFDQPDVAAAKEATNRVLGEGLPDIELAGVDSLLGQVLEGDYVAILAFVDPGDEALLERIEAARRSIRNDFRVATTVGVGPRYLHSTGQLHKGGPATGVFLQVVGEDPVDVPIPGQPFGFSMLKQAQAAGDLIALQDRGLRAGRVAMDDLLDLA
jgi:transaldolase/glucose-6-phosphate isomerase